MDAFDRFWQWADKPLESSLTIPAELHRAVMEFAAEDRRDRAAVSQTAARTRREPTVHRADGPLLESAMPEPDMHYMPVRWPLPAPTTSRHARIDLF